jgi:hypothetical protein
MQNVLRSDHPAVDTNGLSGDVSAHVAGEEGAELSHIFWLILLVSDGMASLHP